MTLLPMLILATLAGWIIYRERSRQDGARRFVRIDYRSQDRRGGPPRR